MLIVSPNAALKGVKIVLIVLIVLIVSPKVTFYLLLVLGTTKT